MPILQAEHLTFPCYTNTVLTTLSVSEIATKVKHTRLLPQGVNQLYQLRPSNRCEALLVPHLP